MAFTKKEWTDRVAEYINRRVLNKTDGTQEVVIVERSEGDVSVEGDAFNAANMNDLEDRIEAAFSGIELTAEKVEYDDTSTSLGSTTVQGAIEALKKFVSDGKSAIASAITKKGVSTSADATFAAMATNIANIPNANSGTYTPTSRSASLDMGVANTYRYVNTNSVPNTNSATYTPSSNGSALDMGATNTYRYVNTNTVYNSGYNSGKNVSFISTSQQSVNGNTDNNAINISGLNANYKYLIHLVEYVSDAYGLKATGALNNGSTVSCDGTILLNRQDHTYGTWSPQNTYDALSWTIVISGATYIKLTSAYHKTTTYWPISCVKAVYRIG